MKSNWLRVGAVMPDTAPECTSSAGGSGCRCAGIRCRAAAGGRGRELRAAHGRDARETSPPATRPAGRPELGPPVAPRTHRHSDPGLLLHPRLPRDLQLRRAPAGAPSRKVWTGFAALGRPSPLEVRGGSPTVARLHGGGRDRVRRTTGTRWGAYRRGSAMNREEPALAAGSWLSPSWEHTVVGDAMSAPVIVCPADTPLATVARTMATRHVHAVVVTDDDANPVVWRVASDSAMAVAGAPDGTTRRDPSRGRRSARPSGRHAFHTRPGWSHRLGPQLS
jgi:CBS domain-containing protein